MNNEWIEKLVKPDLGVMWLPVLLVAMFIAMMVIFHIWGKRYFRKDYNENTEQVKPYNSGNLDEIKYNIKSANLYWGFKKSMDSYFNFMKKLHNGDLNDYSKWFVIFIAICFLLIGGGLL